MTATGYMEITDFSPGIFSDYHGGLTQSSEGGPIGVNGAATINGTYRCHSDSTGALVPLPKRVTSKTQTLLPGGNANGTTSFYPTGLIASYIIDANVVTGFGQTSTTAGAGDGATVFTMHQFQYSVAGAGTTFSQFFLGRAYREFLASPTTLDFLWTKGSSTNTAAVQLAGGNLTTTRNSLTAGGAGTLYNVVVMGLLPYSTTLQGAGAFAAGEAALTTYDTDNTNGANYPTTGVLSSMFAWPSLSAPGTATVTNIGAGSSFTLGVNQTIGHQGRIVTASTIQQTHLTTTSWRADSLGYYAVNDLITSTTNQLVFGENNISGIGCMASVTADDLFIVKHYGGAVTIRGDVNNPTVVSLPFVESTYGVSAMAAVTPIGVVYGTRNGVFVWGGGQASTKLSTQLEGFFWDHVAENGNSNETYKGNRGRFEYWHPWVCVPNNYLFDTNTKAWWRLEDVGVYANGFDLSCPYNVYSVAASTGALYAFPYKLTATQNALYDRYDPAVLASTYSWQSQPLVESLDRSQSFQDITLVASGGKTLGYQSVTITVSGFDKTGVPVTPVSTEFAWLADGTNKPVILRKNLLANFTAMYIQVFISADGGTTAAPKVQKVQLGHRDGPRSPVSN